MFRFTPKALVSLVLISVRGSPHLCFAFRSASCGARQKWDRLDGGIILRPRATATATRPLRPPPIVAAAAADRRDAGSNVGDGDDDDDEAGAGFSMEELSRRARLVETEELNEARNRLEEANTRSFLKRRPRKLPYEDARRWVQANLGPNTKEEFDDLVANGNLRTPYIPKRPEEYYTETREWVSWDHFLRGIFDDERPSDIKPATGVFD